MKYLILILFYIFALQNDSTKVDSVVVKSIDTQKKFDNTNNKLDSIISILNDTIKNQKR